MPYRDKVVPWLVVGAWAACAAYAFWYFELRDQRWFESATTALFDASERSASAEVWLREHSRAPEQSSPPVKATVVHVYNVSCPCNRFTDKHLAEIESHYRADGVRFVAAIDRSIQTELAWIDSTPAALVYDGAGKLMYYGPYSDSAECGASGGLVERVLDKVLRGEGQRPQKFYGGGCFCNAKSGV